MFFSIDIILMASLHYCLVVSEVVGDCYRNSLLMTSRKPITLTSNWNPVIDFPVILFTYLAPEATKLDGCDNLDM